MYVPGKLKECEKVLVDVGTGYYVEKVRHYNSLSEEKKKLREFAISLLIVSNSLVMEKLKTILKLFKLMIFYCSLLHITSFNGFVLYKSMYTIMHEAYLSSLLLDN